MLARGSTPNIASLPLARRPAPARFRLDPKPAVQSPHADTAFVKQAEPSRRVPTEVLFGSFRLLPSQFLLLEDDEPVPLGSRALDILIVLLERPGELIGKGELMARVWPDVFVGPANLTVHISALRRRLRDGHDGNRLIINIPGRGYRFVAPVLVVRQRAPLAIVNSEGRPGAGLPDRPGDRHDTAARSRA
jgi:DNA-binding winged helix-turn-helix (wHTH) protein